jgi:hypothetical protein
MFPRLKVYRLHLDPNLMVQTLEEQMSDMGATTQGQERKAIKILAAKKSVIISVHFTFRNSFRN